jgi:hypothetical protein
MLAKGLRSHTLYNCAGYVLSYIKIVYKPRNIPVQDECRLLIKTIVFIEHHIVKEILHHGLCNPWKTFSLLYRPSTVNPVCHYAPYNSCGLSSCSACVDQLTPGEPTNRARHWLSCRLLQNCGSLANGTNHLRRMSVIVEVGSLLLSALLFKVRRLSPTLYCRAELCVDHQTVVDWSQFCRKAMSHFILSCSLQLFLWCLVGGAKMWK